VIRELRMSKARVAVVPLVATDVRRAHRSIEAACDPNQESDLRRSALGISPSAVGLGATHDNVSVFGTRSVCRKTDDFPVPVTTAAIGGFLAVAENGWVSGNLLRK
jgi:hypothetical protein